MHQTSRIRLITKADDLGSNSSANRAFYDAYQRGLLRNGVVMACCEGAEEAAELFRDETGFCMGLHLTLNAEWDRVKWGPVLPPEQVPTLVDDNGRFFATTQLLHDHRPVLGEALAELQAQLDRARALGFGIRFADEHMGFSWAVDGLSAELPAWCARNGILCDPCGFARLPETSCDGDPVERFIARLAAAAPGLYYIHMGHPAYDTHEMRQLGHEGYWRVAEEREWDRLRLMDSRVLEAFETLGVEPVTLTEVWEHDETGNRTPGYPPL